MPNNPKMRSRAEVESALRFARQRHAAEDAAMRGSPAPELGALTRVVLWAGRIDAYEYVLGLEPGEEPKA